MYASVFAAAGATRPASSFRVAMSGAIISPAGMTRNAIVAGEVASASGRNVIGSSTATRRCTLASDPLRGRAPYTSPPVTLPSAHSATSTPASSGSPSWSANAGSATSSAPNAKPTGSIDATSVRIPGIASAPSRPVSAG